VLDAGQQRVQQVEVESEAAIVVHWQRGQCVKVEAERQPIVAHRRMVTVTTYRQMVVEA
jgi:hypothetical protein